MDTPENLGGALAKKITESESLLLEIYKDLAQPGVKKVGMALETVFDFASLPLMPFKYGTMAVRLNMENKFERYRKKLEAVPVEKIAVVPPEIGVPIMESLTHTTNENLSELFLNLLAKASHVDTAGEAHPAFISIIKELAVDEAKILQLLNNNNVLPYCNLEVSINDAGNTADLSRYLTLTNAIKLDFPTNTEAYYSHLIAKGIIQDFEQRLINQQPVYEAIKQEYQELYEVWEKGIKNNPSAEGWKLSWTTAHFKVTDFGRVFMKACLPPPIEVKVTRWTEGEMPEELS
ncbi:DUF4393 domain-containing protein [Spirosoma litoris]